VGRRPDIEPLRPLSPQRTTHRGGVQCDLRFWAGLSIIPTMSASETGSAATSASAWMPRPLLSDARLVRLAGRGDQPAFEAIFRRYLEELYLYFRALLADAD